MLRARPVPFLQETSQRGTQCRNAQGGIGSVIFLIFGIERNTLGFAVSGFLCFFHLQQINALSQALAILLHQNAGFFEAAVGGGNGAHEFLNSEDQSAQGSGHSVAFFHRGSSHDLGRDDTAVDDGDADDGSLLTDQGNNQANGNNGDAMATMDIRKTFQCLIISDTLIVLPALTPDSG